MKESEKEEILKKILDLNYNSTQKTKFRERNNKKKRLEKLKLMLLSQDLDWLLQLL